MRDFEIAVLVVSWLVLLCVVLLVCFSLFMPAHFFFVISSDLNPMGFVAALGKLDVNG